VTYVTTAFPWRSETAVIKEAFELDRAGFDLAVISLKRIGFDGIFDPKAEVFRGRTWYPTPGFWLRSLAGCASALVRRRSFRALVGATLRGSGRHLPKTLYILAMIPGLARRLRAGGVQYVHANFASFQGYAAWAIHRLTGIPFGFTVHAHDIFLDHFLMPEKVADAALVISISRYNVDYMREQFGIDPGAVEVIHSGVDLEEFRPSPGGDEEPPLLLSVGRLHPMKGFDTLLDACARLRDRLPFRCAIVGSGPERAAIEARVRALRLGDRVAIRTGVRQADLVDLYRRCRLFVQPCRRAPDGQQDGIPATLMEAMAVGRPVVSTRISGIPELVEDGREGLLVPPGDAPALAEAIASLLGDRERCARMGEAARRKVSAEFDAAANARRLAARIRAVVAAHRPEARA
jgi:glycosyltransferase involved in cell wall biosynthesis